MTTVQLFLELKKKCWKGPATETKVTKSKTKRKISLLKLREEFLINIKNEGANI